MYFIVGEHDGWTARFQLSFKYRLFDLGTGFGREQPWLSGFYFGYTQNSIWDLSSQSKPFRDTSYRPQFFWKWDRSDDKTFVDSVRLGLEHESNGGDAANSRSINIAFIRPEWHHRFANRHEIQFMPKLYDYLEKGENPDIQQYRGYVDWQLRYDAAGEWVGTLIGRYGTSGKGSLGGSVEARSRCASVGRRLFPPAIFHGLRRIDPRLQRSACFPAQDRVRDRAVKNQVSSVRGGRQV